MENNSKLIVLDRMHALVPTEQTSIHAKQILTRTQPFEMFYTLNCQNLCADFQEDLDFRFSWGITAMINRFTGKAKGKAPRGAILNNHHSNSIPQMLTPNGEPKPTPLCLIPGGSNISPEQLSVISRFALASIGSQGTVGGLVVGGLVSANLFGFDKCLVLICECLLCSC